MNSIDLAKEIEGIVTDLCKCANKQDKYAIAVVNEIRKELEILDILKEMFEQQWLKVIRDDYGFCVITSDKFDDDDFYISNITYAKLKEWMENERSKN